MIEMSEIVAPPFGFQLIIDPKDNEHYNGFNITNFVDCKYNTIATVTMPIVFYEVNNIFPDDYRSKEEIIAQIEKSEAFKRRIIMGLYEGIKDAIGLAQKADNIDLYKQLLDLGAQALERQAEITRLREENAE